MKRANGIHLSATLLFLAAVMLVPQVLANRVHTSAYDDLAANQQERADLYFQDSGSGGSMSCGAPCRLQNPFILTTGETYIIAYGAGASQQPSFYQTLGNTSGPLWDTDFTVGPPTLDFIASGVEATLLAWNDSSGNGGFAVVRFKAINNESIIMNGGCGFPNSCSHLGGESYEPNVTNEDITNPPEGVLAVYFNNGFPLGTNGGTAVLMEYPGETVVPSVANGTAVGCSVFALNWTAPGDFPNLTSYRVYRNSSVYPVNRTFSVPPEGNFSLRLLNDTYPKISAALAYSVVGVNASGGASPPSNVVSFTPPAISSVGDCGLAFGGMAKSEFLEMAGLTGASEDALGILLSIVLVLAGAGAGFAIMAAGGAAMGAAAGMLLSVALGYLPLWAIMFSLGLLVGGYFISKPGAGRRRGK